MSPVKFQSNLRDTLLIQLRRHVVVFKIIFIISSHHIWSGVRFVVSLKAEI